MTSPQIPQNRTDPEKFVVLWNMQYPFDYWWRKKHSIAFGSQQHLEANHIFMYMEWEEDKMFREMMEDKENDEDELELPPALKDKSLKAVKLTTKEIDKEFADMDLTQFNNSGNG